MRASAAKLSTPPKLRKVIAWMPPRLEKWQREAMEQGWFDWALPKWEKLTTAQVAKALARSPRTVHEMIQLGQLEAFGIRVTGERTEYRVTRRSALLHLAANSTLDPRDLIARVAEFFHALDDKTLLASAEALRAERTRRSL